MRQASARHPTEWRNACVVRAQTIAGNLRMIEIAVEGGLPAFGQGGRTRVQVNATGITSISSHVCVHVGQDRMRVLVGGRERGIGERFMWSLIEGARVRLTVPDTSAAAAASAHSARSVAVGPHIRMGLGGIGAGGRHAGDPANGNLAKRISQTVKNPINV